MKIQKRYDIEQVFTVPHWDYEATIPTRGVGGQLLSIDLIPDTYFFVAVIENDTDEKYFLIEMKYGFVVDNASTCNGAIEKGLKRLEFLRDKWAFAIRLYLNSLPYPYAMYDFPMNEFVK